MMKRISLFTAAIAVSMFSGVADAALVNAYRADNVDNTATVIDDLQNVLDLGDLGVNTPAVTSNYTFGSAWTAATGGIGATSGEVNPFNGFGGTGTIELFIKTDLTSESLSGTSELVFEAGAQGIGFSLGIVPNTAGGDPLLRFFNNHTEFTISLATLDDSDFIQVAAIIDESMGGSSFVTLIARDANGTTVTGTDTFSGNNDIAGADGMGVFATDGIGLSGQGDSGGLGGGATAFGNSFQGQVAAFNIYDDAEEEATLLASYNEVIPEPASLALIGAGGLLMLRRRK